MLLYGYAGEGVVWGDLQNPLSEVHEVGNSQGDGLIGDLELGAVGETLKSKQIQIT